MCTHPGQLEGYVPDGMKCSEWRSYQGHGQCGADWIVSPLFSPPISFSASFFSHTHIHTFCASAWLTGTISFVWMCLWRQWQTGKLESEAASYHMQTKSSLWDSFNTSLLFNFSSSSLGRRFVNYDSVQYEGKFLKRERCILGVTVSPLAISWEFAYCARYSIV